MLHPIQHHIMPNLAFGAPEKMYVRVNKNVHVLFHDKKMLFKEGGKVTFDTFFNGVTVGAWRKHCALNDLHLVIRGNGRFILRFGLHRIGHAQQWLNEQIIDLQEDNDLIVDLAFWKDLDDGMLYFSLEALEEAGYTGGYFATSTPPANKVKLGIVITHFNRKQYVLPAIRRIRDELLNDPLYKGNIELAVVDNSMNITSDEACGITLIPNKNLGGSGGFTRGLLHLKDEGLFTHCLFMDDDASCEIESIRRCYHLLQFSLTNRFSVSGSQMRELEPFMLHEKGGGFRGGNCTIPKFGLNLMKVNHLLYAEREEAKTDYGGWWFFAFKIADVWNFSFPFFVRGDDILFGLQNDFAICTLNGIGCWAEDFSHKESPLTKYLTVRAHILLMTVFEEAEIMPVLKVICRWHIASLLSYNYASAKAVRLALTHFQLGPKFWLDNMDTSAIRSLIAEFSWSERLESINRAELQLDYPRLKSSKLKYSQLKYSQLKYPGKKESRVRKWVRILTLNGFLLPSFMLKNRVIFQHKNFRAFFKDIFLYEKVLYEHVPVGQGYIALHDKKKFFVELFAFMLQLGLFAIRYKSLKQEYNKAMPEMTSEAFWRKIYADQ